MKSDKHKICLKKKEKQKKKLLTTIGEKRTPKTKVRLVRDRIKLLLKETKSKKKLKNYGHQKSADFLLDSKKVKHTEQNLSVNCSKP